MGVETRYTRLEETIRNNDEETLTPANFAHQIQTPIQTQYIPYRPTQSESEQHQPYQFRYQPQYQPQYHSQYRPQYQPQHQPQSLSNSPYRLPTPSPLPPISWPGVLPSRDPSAASSLSIRPRLTAPLQESLAWETSTHFRGGSDGSKTGLLTWTGGIEDGHANTNVIARQGGNGKQYFRNPRHLREVWRGGVARRMPWRGVASLVGIVNDAAAEAWPVQPHVYLSVLEILICLCMLAALSEGVVIVFWRRLLHGMTIANVYDNFESASVWAAIRRVVRGRFNRVGVATLLALVSVARGPLFQRAVTVTTGNRFALHPTFVVIGILLSILGVASALPLYHGFWELGRDVSLNPLEIARAFGTPLLDGMEGNATAADIELERGHLTVRYGAVERYGGEKVLRVAITAKVNVRVPWEGEVFG
ncbi:hypothetical protein BKA63DRAFT_423047 [Paraphoma chrysanthemicola]|nr:hypothetical protein BKA63DRAFT_423047 [Paraphoma chrysanthemicola]